jgi:hypothetical protein
MKLFFYIILLSITGFIGYASSLIILDYRIRSEYEMLKMCLEDFYRDKGRYPNQQEGIKVVLKDNIEINSNDKHMVMKCLRNFSFGKFVYIPDPADSISPKSYKLVLEVFPRNYERQKQSKTHLRPADTPLHGCQRTAAALEQNFPSHVVEDPLNPRPCSTVPPLFRSHATPDWRYLSERGRRCTPINRSSAAHLSTHPNQDQRATHP